MTRKGKQKKDLWGRGRWKAFRSLKWSKRIFPQEHKHEDQGRTFPRVKEGNTRVAIAHRKETFSSLKGDVQREWERQGQSNMEAIVQKKAGKG